MQKHSVEYRNQQYEISEENRSFSGYGIVFNSDSVPMVIYDRDEGHVKVYEQITRESIEAADTSDVIAAINHNFDKILGRTSSGTLELTIDDTGMKYRLSELPNTTYANNLRESASRGDISGSSFTFSLDMSEGYDIEERGNGDLVARPKKIVRVYEMGPVTNPAYPATIAENRSEALFKSAQEYLKSRDKQKDTKNHLALISEEETNTKRLKIRLSEEEAAI